MATAQATKNSITLKGSTAIVTEFFGYAINSILYQRGIYPPDQFERKQKYGLTMLVTADDNLKAYIRNILAQLNGLSLLFFICVCAEGHSLTLACVRTRAMQPGCSRRRSRRSSL